MGIPRRLSARESLWDGNGGGCPHRSGYTTPHKKIREVKENVENIFEELHIFWCQNQILHEKQAQIDLNSNGAS